MANTAKTTEIIEIKPIENKTVTIRIEGDTPLIMHAWSEKAKRMMLEAQTGKSKGKKKELRNPVDDFIRSMYWLTPMPEDGTEESFETAIENGARFGFPLTAFKQASISAAYRMGWVKNQIATSLSCARIWLKSVWAQQTCAIAESSATGMLTLR